MKRDFLTILDRSTDELKALIDGSIALKKYRDSGAALPAGINPNGLAGKSVGLMFEKPSTRTRISFEVGVAELGGHPLFISSNDTQMKRGESMKDTAKVLSRYLHGAMFRTFGHDRLADFAKHASIPVINGLTDEYHPCQIMADIMTFYMIFKQYKGIKVAFVGDGNNVAHSWLNGAARFGFDVAIASPKGAEPKADIVKRAQEEALKTGAKIMVTNSAEEAAKGAHVITTDVWASMGQEDDKARKHQLLLPYQVNAQLFKLADPDAIFLHCLPAHVGEEVTEEVFESAKSKVYDEAENRLHVQKAIMLNVGM